MAAICFIVYNEFNSVNYHLYYTTRVYVQNEYVLYILSEYFALMLPDIFMKFSNCKKKYLQNKKIQANEFRFKFKHMKKNIHIQHVGSQQIFYKGATL